MAENSKIEWCDRTFNTHEGCEQISPGCKNCYAEAMAMRLQKMGQANYTNGFKVTLQPHMLDHPLRWKKPKTIFVNSMSDLFHKEVPLDYIKRVFDVMNQAHWHTFQVLTKRVERMAEVAHELTWTPNIWAGTSVENQEMTDKRIPELLKIPAAVRFLSCEPLLGPVEMRPCWINKRTLCADCPSAQEGAPIDCEGADSRICWVIVGGESGSGARPMHPDWARSLRDQCQAAGVPFFFKQWGEWAETECVAGGDLGGDMRRGIVQHVRPDRECDGRFKRGDVYMRRVGKKAAGRLLDGQEWSQFPKEGQ